MLMESEAIQFKTRTGSPKKRCYKTFASMFTFMLLESEAMQFKNRTGSPKKMSLNFRDSVNFHVTGIGEQTKNQTGSPKRVVTELSR
jgi:hypothetical protein